MKTMAPNRDPIRASEIGTYLFCQRAWWFHGQGKRSTNVLELARGTREHVRHWSDLRTARRLRIAAFAFAALSVLLLFLQFSN